MIAFIVFVLYNVEVIMYHYAILRTRGNSIV